ncbi:hypothetical protein FXO37_08135 [Capsicum annuum]|nr:hypothetical protein FXO37_08135 [Capsicum annuum]
MDFYGSRLDCLVPMVEPDGPSEAVVVLRQWTCFLPRSDGTNISHGLACDPSGSRAPCSILGSTFGLAYSKAYDAVNRIMDLHFCKKLKEKYDQFNNQASACGMRFDLLVSTLDWDEEEIIKYVRGERPNPHGKSWTEENRIFTVMSMDGIHYRAIEILLGEEKIKVYDCNEPAIDEVIFFHVQPLMELFPVLLRESKLMTHFPKKVLMKKSWDFEGQNKGMTLPKNYTSFACYSHALAHIECLLTSTKIVEPTAFLCDNAVINLQEVWAYGLLTGCLELVK